MSINITPVASGYQEIHPYSAMNIDSVKINTSLIMMKEWPFSHHYQGNLLDFNNVNIHHTVCRDVFLDIHLLEGWYQMIWSAEIILFSTLPGEYIGKYRPRDSISRYAPFRNRSSRGNASALEKSLGPRGDVCIHPSSRQCMDTVYSYSKYIWLYSQVNTAKHGLLWFNCLQRIQSKRWSSSLLIFDLDKLEIQQPFFKFAEGYPVLPSILK